MDQINPSHNGMEASDGTSEIPPEAPGDNEATERAEEAEGNADEEKRRDLGAASFAAIPGLESIERKTFPPVESIPSLFELGIKGPDSLHGHKYDSSNTVWAHASTAEDTAQSERTHQQVELLDDVKSLKEFAPYTSNYMDIFTPAELHALTGKLNLLRQKNRPDFNSVEARIIDIIICNRESVDGDVAGIAKRAEQNAGSRRGMQWGTLNKLAGVANDILVLGMYKGDDRKQYIVPIDRDPDHDRTDKKSIDLKNVYQFIATDHALSVHGERSATVHEKRLQTFVENYGVITRWYEEAKSGIDQLPTDRDFVDSLNNQIGGRRKPARSGVQFYIGKLLETMEKRHAGGEMSGKFKSYEKDPAGAINLQLLLAHKIEAIREKLGAGIHPADQEITPLDDFDF